MIAYIPVGNVKGAALIDFESKKNLILRLKQGDLTSERTLGNLMDMCYATKEDDVKYAVNEGLYLSGLLQQEVRRNPSLLDLYWKCKLFLAPYDFDSFMLYIEKERDPKQRFYMPRRSQLRKLGIVQALQALEDDELDLLTMSMVPGAGKTTLGEMFLGWVIGRDPDGYSLFASHSGDITRMFYDAVNNITGSPEYLWADVFPTVIRQSENAKTEQINFGKYKPFKSLQCTSVGSKNAGKVRCNKYLYCDDLIGGIEEAMSKPRLDKLWTTYSVDLRQRKKDKCKELHVATRWSVHDVIGRLEERFKDDPRARFLAFPDIDPETGQSNFEYAYGVGFSVEYFHDMEETMDDVSYRCLYKSEPIEREGLLYTEEELRRYLSLPDGEPDAVLAVCDTKNKGADYLVLPSMLQYGNDYYLSLNSLCDDNSDYAVQYSRMADVIIRDKIQRLEVEANNGGDRIAETVAGMVKGKSTCSITTKYTTTNKETKIIVNAEWVKRNVIFPDRSLYRAKSDIGKFMAFLLSYTVKGKAEHDDVPDALAAFAIFVQGMLGRDTKIIQSPF